MFPEDIMYIMFANESHPPQLSKGLTWVVCATNIYISLMLSAIQILPPPPNWVNHLEQDKMLIRSFSIGVPPLLGLRCFPIWITECEFINESPLSEVLFVLIIFCALLCEKPEP